MSRLSKELKLRFLGMPPLPNPSRLRIETSKYEIRFTSTDRSLGCDIWLAIVAYLLLAAGLSWIFTYPSFMQALLSESSENPRLGFKLVMYLILGIVVPGCLLAIFVVHRISTVERIQIDEEWMRVIHGGDLSSKELARVAVLDLQEIALESSGWRRAPVIARDRELRIQFGQHLPLEDRMWLVQALSGLLAPIPRPLREEEPKELHEADLAMLEESQEEEENPIEE